MFLWRTFRRVRNRWLCWRNLVPTRRQGSSGNSKASSIASHCRQSFWVSIAQSSHTTWLHRTISNPQTFQPCALYLPHDTNRPHQGMCSMPITTIINYLPACLHRNFRSRKTRRLKENLILILQLTSLLKVRFRFWDKNWGFYCCWHR